MPNWKSKTDLSSHFYTNRWLFIFFLGWIWYFIQFWSRSLFTNANGGLSVGHVNMWGDWAAHFTMGAQMANRGNWLKSGPFLLSEPLQYPFVADWISAQILKLGGSLQLAYVFPSMITSILLVGAVWWAYRHWLGSILQASLAVSIFLWNGGLGFVYFFKDVVNSSDPWLRLVSPAHEYTRLDEHAIKWINIIDSMIIPQRAFTLGFPVAITALTLFYHLFLSPHKPSTWTKADWSKAVVAGILFGLLPIIHTHSFLASFVIASCWFIGWLFDTVLIQKPPISELKTHLLKALAVLVPSGLIAVFLVLTLFSSTISNHSFFSFQPGWLATTYQENWLWWWFKNWSITPFLALAFWFYILKKMRLPQKSTYFFQFLPFFLLFVAINLYLFQPFAWDNTKLVVWSHFGFSALVAAAVAKLWAKRQLKIVAISILFLITASGIIDSYWIQRTELHNFEMYSAEELRLANWVQTNTAPNAIWLTGDQHNHWLYNLTGRQSVITYRGWLWTHGYNYSTQEQAVTQMYASPEHNTARFKEHQVQYVVIGPNETLTWRANQHWFNQNFIVIQTSPNYTLYQVKYER